MESKTLCGHSVLKTVTQRIIERYIEISHFHVCVCMLVIFSFA